MKLIIVLGLLFFSFTIQSQDTIYKKNGEIIIARVLKILPDEVSYKRYDLLDGPLYIVPKRELKKIKCSNGYFASYEKKEGKIDSDKDFFEIKDSTRISDMIIPSRRKGIYFYKNETTNERSVFLLVSGRNFGDKNLERNLLINDYQKLRGMQYGFGIGGPTLSLVGVGGLILIADGFGGTDAQLAAIVTIPFGILITSLVMSNEFKKRKINRVNRLANLYNKNL